MKSVLTASFLSSLVTAALIASLLSDRGQPAAHGQLRPADATEAELTPDERVNIRVYETSNRSVVNITTSVAGADSLLFFEPPAKGAGSGWVYDRDGRIVTNYHVIADASEITVTFHDGSQFEAGVVGFDEINDIAVLKVDAPASLLAPLPRGRSDRLRVGQKVFAIGNPFGWERTMSQGMVSSLNRTLPSRRHRSMKSIIQIDGALNKGNSGGPLLDTSGRVVGMNVAIASASGDSAGIGFAIPVNTLARIVPELIEHGRVTRPTIGIAAIAPRNGRLTIAAVVPGGPAERAGLRGYKLVKRTYRRGPFIYEEKSWDRDQADEIIDVDGVKVETLEAFLGEIDKYKPGDTVEITVLREGKRVRVPVKLGEERG